MDIVHTPVLLEECLSYLSPIGESYEKDAFMVDSTLGEGGHSFNFLTKYKDLKIIGLDADPNIHEKAKQRLSSFGSRMKFNLGWFNDFYANYPENLPRPNILLFDLGISVFHYEKSGRGFTFRYDEPLDMRLNESAGISAEELVNKTPEEELANIIFDYSEERYSRRIARSIVEARENSPIVMTKQLADIIYKAVPSAYRHGGIHPATKTFQAIRIVVNGEFIRLKQVLRDAFNVLKVEGKMGVITFHSLEDKIVKNFFRDLGKKCICPPEQPICICRGRPEAEIITRKPVGPTEKEIKENSPSRSAKLRVVRKIWEA